MAKKVILASGSPRRKELLEQVGVEFEQRVSGKEERYTAKRDCEGTGTDESRKCCVRYRSRERTSDRYSRDRCRYDRSFGRADSWKAKE